MKLCNVGSVYMQSKLLSMIVIHGVLKEIFKCKNAFFVIAVAHVSCYNLMILRRITQRSIDQVVVC